MKGLLLFLFRKSSDTFPPFNAIKGFIAVIVFSCFCIFSTDSNAQTIPNGTAASSGTYTVSANVCTLTVQAWGAGGAGGNASNSGNFAEAGGGGGGAFSTTNVAVTPGQQVILAVGVGGTASGTNGGSGNAGGNSEVYNITRSDTLARAQGGRGGSGATSGTTSNVAGGDVTKGTGTGFSGGAGRGGSQNSSYTGGGGGGGAGTNGGGTAGGTTGGNHKGGAGGTVGGGVGGDGGNVSSSGGSSANGTAATVSFGGGGGGAVVAGVSANKTGGAGRLGQIIISYSTAATPSGGTMSTGASTGCANATGNTYAVTGVSNVTAYSWTVGGGTVASGNGTSSVSITWGATAGTYTVTCTPWNNCVSGTPLTKSVVVLTAPATPTAITPPSPICQGSTGTYSVPNLGFTYTWSVTGAGWSLNSANGSSSINIIAGTANGNVSVTAANICFTSAPKTTTFAPNLPVPETPSPIVQF